MKTSEKPILGKRIEALEAEAIERDGSVVSGQNPKVQEVALRRAMKPGRSRVQVRAASLPEQVRLADIEIRPGWRLAGPPAASRHAPRFPGFAGTDRIKHLPAKIHPRVQ